MKNADTYTDEQIKQQMREDLEDRMLGELGEEYFEQWMRQHELEQEGSVL